MSKIQIILIVIISLILGWVMAMSLLSLMANGYFYHINQPVRIIRVEPKKVVLKFDRFSRLNMNANHIRELECEESVHHLPKVEIYLEQGYAIFNVDYPLLMNSFGECFYRGVMEYRPFGPFGPTLRYSWHSEKFNVP